MAVKYDKSIDYQAKINQAKKSGDTVSAKNYEAQRNQKIADMNSSNTNANNYTQTYNYTPKSSGGGTKALSTSGSSYTPLGDNSDTKVSSSTDYAAIQKAKAGYNTAYQNWQSAKTSGNQQLIAQYKGQMDDYHTQAENVRSGYGYSGGVDGSNYTSTEQLPEAINTVDDVVSQIDNIKQDYTKLGDQGLALVSAQYTQMSQMIDGLESQIMGQIQGQMNGDDPALKQAIGVIKDEVNRMRDDTLDELNARGLVQSGIYAEALSRLNKNELTSTESLLASHFGDLQNQLNNALISIASMRINSLSTNQQAQTNMLMNNQNGLMQLGVAGVNAGLTERGQNINVDQFNQSLANNKDQFNQTLANNQDQFNQGMTWDKNKFSQQLAFDNTALDKQISASRANAGSGNSLGWAQLNYQKSSDAQARQDALTYANQQTTAQQVSEIVNSGMDKKLVSQINGGQLTVQQAQSQIASMGYTEGAQNYLSTYLSTYATPRIIPGGGGGGQSYVPPKHHHR